MNFPKNTLEIIYGIEDYFHKMEYNGCCSIIMSVNNDEKDIKIISYQQQSLRDKINNFMWMIFFMILTIGLIFSGSDTTDGCIRLNIKSNDRNLLKHLKLYFCDKSTKYLSKNSICARIIFCYEYV